MAESETTLIFTYGTLKMDFPNYHLMQDLIHKNDAVHLGTCSTNCPYPLVIGPHGIPYLINLPGSGHQVKGELYSVTSTRGGLARVDELEGISRGHYERLPIKVIMEKNGRENNINDNNCDIGDGVVFVDAEAYFAHRGFGPELLERKKRQVLCEYTEREAIRYVRVQDRPNKGSDILGDIRLFLSSKD